MNKEETWLLNEKYQGVESSAFHADCARLLAGEPLAYLIGNTPFLNCTIYLDSHPLIPRPETEYWTNQAITTIKNPPRTSDVLGINQGVLVPEILDLCAGSGAIGVAVAQEIPEAMVTFAELDPAHLPTIKKNFTFNSTVNSTIKGAVNCHIIESDLFGGISPEAKFDFILTNPPYIDAAANTVDQNVATHEPHLALFGGPAGMEIIARIIQEAPTRLTATGQLWIEHEPVHSAAILDLAQQTGFDSAITHPDQYGIPRFSVLTMAQ